MKKLIQNVALFIVFLFTLSACISSQDQMSTDIAMTVAVSDTESMKTPTKRPPTSTPYVIPTNARATEIAIETETARQASSEDVIVRATTQAISMFDRIERLSEDGYIDATEGTYYLLNDFDETWAQLGWHEWFKTTHTPSQFVIRADAAWESASDKADWWASGCGFIFGEKGKDDHYLVYLGLDGWVYLSEVRNGNWVDLGYSRYGTLDLPNGDAEIMLVVYDKRIHFFVNNQLIKTRQVSRDISGNLALTLLSGTNKDFGTRCRMTNLELWEFEKLHLSFQDDFSDPNSGWSERETDFGGLISYEGGLYTIYDPGDDEISTIGLARRNLVNVTIQIEATSISASSTSSNEYGIGCRIQSNFDGYYMSIYEDASFQIYKWLNSDEVSTLASGHNPIAIQSGLATNIIRIVCDGNYLALFVNDTLVAKTTDDSFYSGDIALYATSYDGTPVKVHFDNLEVRAP